ncbi:MAG: ABC transporter permease subunit [Acidimicrobiia bacterium]
MIAGVLILGLMGCLAVAHPVLQATVWRSSQQIYLPLTGYDPAVFHPSGPGPGHLFGTDALGRDVLSLLTYALGPTLGLALVAATAVAALSVMSAILSAYYRGAVDTLLSKLADGLTLLPAPIVLLVIGLARPDFGIPQLGIIFGLVFGLGPAAIVVRSRALSVMAKPFIDASRVAGAGARRIMAAHLIPDVLPVAMVQVMAGVTGVIVAHAFGEFLGSARGRPGLGNLVYLALSYQGVITNEIAWTQLVAASLTISLLAGSFYLVGVGLREALDPRFGHGQTFGPP